MTENGNNALVSAKTFRADQYGRPASVTASAIRRRPSWRCSRRALNANTSESRTRRWRLRGRRSEGISPSSRSELERAVLFELSHRVT